MGGRVPVEPCAGKSGHLSGGRLLAGSSNKLRVWRGPIRDPKIAAFGSRCAIIAPLPSRRLLLRKNFIDGAPSVGVGAGVLANSLAAAPACADDGDWIPARPVETD